MQSVGIMLQNAETDYSGRCCYSPAADPSDNIAFTSIVLRPTDKCIATGVVASGIADFPVAIAHPKKEWIAHFVPSVAGLATVGKYPRFSVCYRMKVK